MAQLRIDFTPGEDASPRFRLLVTDEEKYAVQERVQGKLGGLVARFLREAVNLDVEFVQRTPDDR
jgi:hypothetical protein